MRTTSSRKPRPAPIAKPLPRASKRATAAQRAPVGATSGAPAAGQCVKFGCGYANLVFLEAGLSHQTGNGFFTIGIDGWYCPRCGAGYGGSK